MSPTITIVLIIVVLVVIAAIFYGVQVGRRKKLQSTFGPEYDRAVADTGNRSEAEKELRERERRHASLELNELSPESKAKYQAAWEEVQIQFVDNPSEAVGTADELVTRLITERGYPTGEYDDRLADLSVEHANTLQHYRDAHEISERNKGGTASTEDLRQALVHYRALFADLLGTEPMSNGVTTTTVTESDGTTALDADRSTVTEPDRTTEPDSDRPTVTEPDRTTEPDSDRSTVTEPDRAARTEPDRAARTASDRTAPAPRTAADNESTAESAADAAPDKSR